MLLAVLSRMLRRTLSLDSSCEKEKTKKDNGKVGIPTAKHRESKLPTKVDVKDSNGKIPDPWFN
jgi:hypothetical protein